MPNIGALIIRGFWDHYTIIIIRNIQNSIGNHLGPYIRPASQNTWAQEAKENRAAEAAKLKEALTEASHA